MNTSLIVTGLLYFCSGFGSADEGVAKVLTYTFQSGGRERTYHLRVTESGGTENRVPLLLTFHGAGGSGLSAMEAYSWLAKEEGVLVAGPDGVNKRWNAGNADEVKATGDVDDVTFVGDLIAELVSNQNADPERVYAVGFSNGAALCHLLAAKLPERFAAVSASGATLGKVTQPLLRVGCPVPIQIMVGNEDPMFGKSGDLMKGTFLSAEASAREWVRQNQCAPPIARESPVPHQYWPPSGHSSSDVELWIVENAVHTPFLGGSEWNAAKEQWRFLTTHRRTAEESAKLEKVKMVLPP